MSPSASLVLAALALTSCRSFPVGLFVPDVVLDELAQSRYEEHLDPRELARAVRALHGATLAPAAIPGAHFFRLDAEPVLGSFEPREFDSLAGPSTAGLEPGDLVLVKNGRAQSLGTTLTFEEFTFYDHMGVLVVRDGRWLVCDSWPSFHAFGKSEDFASRFRGGVRATPLGRFLAHYENLLVVRLPDPERNAHLAAAALASLEEEIEYDPHHDPADPRLSCSEYFLLLLGRVGYEPPSAARAVSRQPGLRRMLAALGFPCDAFFVPDQFAALPGVRTVAWISRHRSRAAARAIEVAFALLHERFQAEGRVADLLRVDRFALLGYRENVALFLGWAEALAAVHGDDDTEHLRAALARLQPLFFLPRPAP